MEQKYLKTLDTNMVSKNKYNIYRTWTFTDVDITPFNTEIAWYNYVTYILGLDYTTLPKPSFPGLNVKSAVSKSMNDSGYYPTQTDVDNDGYELTRSYLLANGDHFYPSYEIDTNQRCSDGSYMKINHYSINQLFYAAHASYINELLTNDNDSILYENAFILEIPRKYMAHKIEQGTFVFNDETNTNYLPYWNIAPYNNAIYNPISVSGLSIRDRSGSLYDNNFTASGHIGNIFYDMGLVVITDNEYAKYFKENYVVSCSYNPYSSYMTSSYSCSITFDSSHTILENKFMCVVKKGEFSVSTNPSLYDITKKYDGSVYTSDNNQIIIHTPITSKTFYDTIGSSSKFERDSTFAPFVTSIGLYDNTDKLIAIAKLGHPIKLDTDMDSVFVVKYDL